MKNKYMVILSIMLLMILSFVQAQAQPMESRRFALIIGNSNYTELGKLKNPGNDASDMATALKDLGFNVTLLLDADLRAMDEAIPQFANNLGRYEDAIGFFYYAGHGVQSQGINYLIPLNAKIPNESYLKERAISLQTVLDSLLESRNSLNIVVLDACRDNPFAWVRSGSRGLSVVGAQPAGSIVVYATSAGAVALDGEGRNGIFTGELLKHLATPEITVNEVFMRTGLGVQSLTSGKQTPAIFNQFYKSISLNTSRPASTAETIQAEIGVNGKRPTVSIIQKYGSIKVTTTTGGTLFINGRELATLPAYSDAILGDIAAGQHKLEMRYADQQVESLIFDLKPDTVGNAVFSWIEKTATTTTTTIPASNKTLGSNTLLDGYFTLGSTKEEVLNVNGTPSRITETSYNNSQTWHYKNGYFDSKVTFNSNGIVTSWDDIADVLKVTIGTKVINATFTLGSTKDDVIKANGTPSRITETSYNNSQTWYYKNGYFDSKVTFNVDGKVISWDDMANVLNITM